MTRERPARRRSATDPGDVLGPVWQRSGHREHRSCVPSRDEVGKGQVVRDRPRWKAHRDRDRSRRPEVRLVTAPDPTKCSRLSAGLRSTNP